jgi:phospholipase/carboxylesterase
MPKPIVTRRQFAVTSGYALAAAAVGGACTAWTTAAEGNDGRLAARPRDEVATSVTSGPLGLDSSGRDGVIQLPSAMPDGKVPLLVFLHGATQNSASMLRRIGPTADRQGVALLCPDSRGTTWDGIRGELGEDVVFLNRALESVFARLAVDPARVAIGGFSDGASYALSLGLANGELFPRVVACSPGFVVSAEPQGRPRFFVSHGTEDQILPIDRCSRVIVPRLRSMGYDVTYREFEGRHELPPDIASEALRWMTAL